MIVNNFSTFENKRVENTNDSTLGILKLDSKPIGFVIEDEPRVVKVAGETRIPAGIYRLVLRKVVTPLTLKYREKFSWFNFHIELENVPGFTGIYIHVGNKEKDTAGCQVIGKDASISNGEYINKYSTVLFEEFYKAVAPALEKGYTLYYIIKD